MSTQRSILPSHVLIASFLALSAGYGSDESSAAECGGHGELHADHCDCHDGYVPSAADETVCVPADDDDDDPDTSSTLRLAIGRSAVNVFRDAYPRLSASPEGETS